MKLSVKVEGRTYEVEVGDLSARPIQATIDGQVFEVWPEETASPFTETVERTPSLPAPLAPAAAAPMPAASGAVLAPIPGAIISIAVKAGDTVEPGQTLCILEAMKMKNAIRATRTGTIAAVRVGVGDTVKHNDVIMEYAD